jgi:hypothetical protein
MAEVIALVLDRHFRALLAGEPEPEPAPGLDARAARGHAPPAPAAAGEPPVAEPATPTRALPSDPAAVDLRLVGFELAFKNPLQPALGVRGLIEPWRSLYVGAALHVGLTSDSEDLAGGGKATSRDGMLRAYAAWGPQLGPVHTYIGPGLRIGFSRGAGRALAQNEVGVRLICALGLDAGAVWVTDDGWSFGASAALDVSFSELSGRFMIEGQEVLALAPVSGWLGVVMGHAF